MVTLSLSVSYWNPSRSSFQSYSSGPLYVTVMDVSLICWQKYQCVGIASLVLDRCCCMSSVKHHKHDGDRLSSIHMPNISLGIDQTMYGKWRDEYVNEEKDTSLSWETQQQCTCVCLWTITQTHDKFKQEMYYKNKPHQQVCLILANGLNPGVSVVCLVWPLGCE